MDPNFNFDIKIFFNFSINFFYRFFCWYQMNFYIFYVTKISALSSLFPFNNINDFISEATAFWCLDMTAKKISTF